MSIKFFCLLLAAICFLVKALSVNTGRVDFMNLGFFFVVLSVLF
jgi:hypothetical protein